MINELKENADRLRNSGVILGLNNRLVDGIVQLTQAIQYDPEKAEFHLQRGVLFKRRKDFNSAIDDFLLGIEKLNKVDGTSFDQQLMNNFQRQVLLTYNDFAMQCFEKGYYDDAIVLLDKAIKIEKNEKGFYANRGGRFIHHLFKTHVEKCFLFNSFLSNLGFRLLLQEKREKVRSFGL